MPATIRTTLLAGLALLLSPLKAAQEVAIQPGPARSILAVKFSPDDSHLISFSVSPDHTLCLWDVKSGRLLWMTATGFVQQRYEYAALAEFAWSEDGRSIVTRSVNGLYQVWDAENGGIVSLSKEMPNVELAGNDEITPRTSPPRQASGRDKVTLSRARTLEAETFSDYEGAIRIRDIRSGRAWWLEAHPGIVRDLAYSRDGSVLAAAGSDGLVYLFAAKSRALTRTLGEHGREVYFLAFCPDGSSLLTYDKGGQATLWNWRTGTILRQATLKTCFPDEPGIDLSPDGRSFLVAGEDHGAEIGLWETATLKPIRKLRVKEWYRSPMGLGSDFLPVVDAAFGQERDQVVAAYDDGSLRIWDTFHGQQIRRYQVGDRISKILPGPESQTVIVILESKSVDHPALFDLKRGRTVASLDGWETDDIEDLAISPDGRYMAASHDESAVFIGPRADDGRIRGLEIGPSGFDALAFSPDGKTLAVGGANQNALIFDVESGARLWQLLPFYYPTELEARLAKEREDRHAELDRALARRAERAALETEEYRKKVRIAFDHYGVMTNPAELRFGESGKPDRSRIVVPAADADAVWFRLRNDSALPIKLDSHSPYMGAAKCAHEFSKDNVLYGLCSGVEAGLRFDVEDKNGKTLPDFSDVIFNVYVLPNTMVLLAVRKGLLDEGATIVLRYTFQNALEEDSYWTQSGKYADYGTEKTIRFDGQDLLKRDRRTQPNPPLWRHY